MKITYLVGNATCPTGDGHKVIMHICNNIGAWGKGFVVPLGNKYPLARKMYLSCEEYGLGTVQFVLAPDDVLIANMVAQNGVKSFVNPTPIDYDALRECLDIVFKTAKAEDRSVHAPKIGSSLAGGDWDIISKIIEDVSDKHDVPCFIYTLRK